MTAFSPKAVALVGILLASSGASFIVGQSIKPKTNSAPLASISSVKGATLFQSQNATIQGKVLKFNDNTLTVQDSKGQTADFAMAKYFSVSKFPNTSGVASVSASVNSLEINKQAMIVLVVQDGEYRVSSVSYLPPAPGLSQVKGASTSSSYK